MNGNDCLNSGIIMPRRDPKPDKLPDSRTEFQLCTTPKPLNSSGIQAWRPSFSPLRCSADYLSFNPTSFNVPVLQDEIVIKFCKILKWRVCICHWENISEIIPVWGAAEEIQHAQGNVTFLLQSCMKTCRTDFY